jgi:hypothetical protein
MDPNAPLTRQPFTQAIWAIALGFAAPWLIILIARWAWERYQDRKASREAQERLRRWEATHPLEPEDENQRLAQIKDRLWLESLSLDARRSILRQRQEEAEREARARTILDAERRAARDGRPALRPAADRGRGGGYRPSAC